MSLDLSLYRIPTHQDLEAYYVPNFLTSDEEEYLIRKITDSPLPKWKNLANRRLQILGGELTSKNVLIPQAFPPFIDKYPDLIRRLRNTGAFASAKHGEPNHVILNEYLPGQGIMPHEDGPAYHPVVATISLGSHAVFHYYRYRHTTEDDSGRAIDPTPLTSVLLEPRSLVITKAALYRDFLHGIDGTEQDRFAPATDTSVTTSGARIANWNLLRGENERKAVTEGGVLQRGTRYSLTCRDVEKVVAANLRIR